MPDLANRYADNIHGEFYVDTECIDCDLCRETASDNFTRNEEEGYSYVYKQPDTAEEKRCCRDAMEACPVEAIGNDGVLGIDDESETLQQVSVSSRNNR